MASKTKRGTAYEHVVKDLVNTLLGNDLKKLGMKPIQVQHNVQKIGKSGCSHQIDVYYEFELGGQKHSVAFECKRFKNAIPIGRVRDFFGVVHDTNIQIGNIATVKGFQSGAEKFAKHYGINLKVIKK